MADNERYEAGEVPSLETLIAEALMVHLDGVVHADGTTFWPSGAPSSGTSRLVYFGEVRSGG